MASHSNYLRLLLAAFFLAVSGGGALGVAEAVTTTPGPSEQIYWPSRPMVGGLKTVEDEAGVRIVIERYMGFFVGFCFVVTIVMIFVSGVELIIGQGDPEAKKRSKRRATWSLVGFIFVLVSYSVVNVALGLPFFSPAEEAPRLPAREQPYQPPAEPA